MWAQLDALPTDPAKLWPIVKADEQLPFSSDPALPKSGQSDLFQSIWNLVTSEPLPAPLQKALYEVAAEIPGVTVYPGSSCILGIVGAALVSSGGPFVSIVRWRGNRLRRPRTRRKSAVHDRRAGRCR